MSTVSERVARGVEWLDRCKYEDPDKSWVDVIDLDRLDMAHRSRCIVGQVFGDYMFGPLSRAEAMAMGLQRTADDDYGVLETEWRRVIVERRESAAGAR